MHKVKQEKSPPHSSWMLVCWLVAESKTLYTWKYDKCNPLIGEKACACHRTNVSSLNFGREIQTWLQLQWLVNRYKLSQNLPPPFPNHLLEGIFNTEKEEGKENSLSYFRSEKKSSCMPLPTYNFGCIVAQIRKGAESSKNQVTRYRKRGILMSTRKRNSLKTKYISYTCLSPPHKKSDYSPVWALQPSP